MFVIAGATGRTGRVVAETLLSQRRKVRAIVREPGKGEALRARAADVVVAALDDRCALERALAGAGGFYAILPEDPAVARFHEHRKRMADAMAAAIRSAGTPHVVFLSALAAAVPAGNGPAKDLHYAENVLRSSGAKVTVIRASYFQDNVLGLACPARHEGVYPNFLPSADVAFPTVATRDIGRLAARCLVEPPVKSEIVDLVGPAYSIREMANQLGRALGVTVNVADIPPADQVDVLVQKGSLPREFADALVEMFACVGSGRVAPQGDRTERGTIELDQVLRDGLREQ